MKAKQTIRKAFTGLLSTLLLVALLLPAAALGAPVSPSSPVNAQSAAASLTLDALEIQAQQTQVTTPRSTGTITNDATSFNAGLPPGTTVLFVIVGVVASANATTGEWQIGTQPVTVYESTGTTITGAPVAGDAVTVVGKRTLSPGPIVAEFISVHAAPGTPGPATVRTALLFNGTVSAVSAASWVVTPPAPAAPVSFSILADAGPLGVGPTVIDAGLGAGSAVTVEYVIDETLQPPPPATPGYQLHAGWNLLSTPVLLKSDASTLDKVFDAANLANVEVAYSYVNGAWGQVTSTYAMVPLNAIFVKVVTGTTATANFVPSALLSTPPSRTLQAGLNLVGPASFGAMPSNQAFISIEKTATGGTGYVMLVSPGLNQPGWSYAAGGQAQDILPYKGYWVVMENADTLYGFSTTPVTP